ncbi:MAG: pyruvate formate-lyase [Lachnospiraceae bacterium]|jgi:pyruvate-formate lyase|nr:pyruvate formate-lyase [Lachnospiraceae bacterium]
MTEKIEQMLTYYVKNREHHKFRKAPEDKYRFAVNYERDELSAPERTVRRLKDMLEEETPVVIPGESIAFLRTVVTVPEIYTAEEFEELSKKHYIHEQGKVCNISPDYMQLLSCGFDEKKREIREKIAEFEKAGKIEKVTYEKSLLDTLEVIEAFTERYALEAERVGNEEVAKLLRKVPYKKPETFLEALQFLRIVHYCLWCSFNYHNTLGRFDQYMYPFYGKDLKEGRLTKESALELVEEFFLCLNKDSDLYTGMQQGDNGQSMVLGGLNPDGTESYNELSDICLQASLELKLIDPKINLRVNKNTPLSMYVRGTELTKQGLGFPQYSNDDIVVKALLNWGYEEKDAYNYAMAACWEFIIPGCGMDIPNINGLSFPACVIASVNRLPEFDTFEDVMADVKKNIYAEAKRLRDSVSSVYMEPAPLLSMLMNGCVERGTDISQGNKYNNFGFHGTGIAIAVDSLASVRKYIYEEKSISKETLLEALEKDFKGYEELANKLRYEGPKMGNDEDEVDELATILLDWFADSMEGYKNERGGIYRVGTGSAMYYIWQSRDEQATPDGRHRGEQFAANYSPSIFTRLDGPISIVKSFTKQNLTRVSNGGPLTIELSDTMFRNEESVEKTAQFVKTFVDLGGHQMQINAVNREQMLDAKKHPENHRNLIVRVWGWSGYFVELDECYQDHIIKRMELVV